MEEAYVEKDADALHKVGDLVQYTEDGAILLCKVLENTSDKDWLRYKLEVMKQEHPSSIVKDAEPGEVFSPVQSRSGAWGGMWHIYPNGTYGRF